MVYIGDKKREYQREWTRRNRKSQREYVRRLRLRVIEKLGGKCINCGCDNPEALEMNHINGGGAKEYRERHGACQKTLYFEILSDKRNDIELTCKVCNALHCLVKIKGLENKWIVTYRK
jgi:hypothetical protein